jgi:trigger factor
MEDWSDVTQHESCNITLLCPDHHGEKTKGWLPLSEVQRANADPFNKRANASSPYTLRHNAPSFRAVLGNVVIDVPSFKEADRLSMVLIDAESQLGFRIEDGHLLMHFRLFDDEDRCVAVIEDNELMYSTSLFDVEMVGTQLTLRSASRAILLRMRFDPEQGVEIPVGRFLRHGVRVRISSDGVSVGESWLSNCLLVHDEVGLAFGEPELMPAAMHIWDVARERGWVVSNDGKVRRVVEHRGDGVVVGLTMEDERVRPVDLVLGTENPVLERCKFVRCYIEGPAMLALVDSSLEDCRFSDTPESVCIALAESRRIHGVVVAKECDFIGCQFGNVGFVVSDAILEGMQAAVV